MIGNPTAGICIQRAEQGCEGIKESDDEDAGSENLQIFRRKAQPEPLTRARQDERNKKQGRVASKGEKFAGLGEDLVHRSTRAAFLFVCKRATFPARMFNPYCSCRKATRLLPCWLC